MFTKSYGRALVGFYYSFLNRTFYGSFEEVGKDLNPRWTDLQAFVGWIHTGITSLCFGFGLIVCSGLNA